MRLWRLDESGAMPFGEEPLNHEGGVRSVAFGPDGILASGGHPPNNYSAGTVRLWRLGESGATRFGEELLKGSGGEVNGVAKAFMYLRPSLL